MKEFWDISYCGLNCARCDLYLVPNEKNAAKSVLSWFKSKGWVSKNVKLEEFMLKTGRQCEGCRGPKDKSWSNDCRIRSCAQSKQLEYCFLCIDFPCKILKDFANDGAAHHKQTVENLKLMKEKGFDEVLKSQSEPVFCIGYNDQ